MHASTEHLLDLGVEGNNLQDRTALCGISSVRASNNLGLGWSIAADWKGIPLNSIGYLSGPINVQCILFKFFHFLSECCVY